ncbi:hypothetical protein D0862_11579 [Hortaea werneckii]|uniref:Uncharacterized protein n=1 Tax=Hortaea werneckii TaxID=91943 RepID=A0A3M7F4Q4_HORWE|nr:hypothetical protein D0862_11579 [Hortaea werneckii]
MKPVVSAFNAWTCIVISVFAIVILSAIGSMFAKGHHTMMGSEEDPKDGGKVAAAVFGAVAVYGVRYTQTRDDMGDMQLDKVANAANRLSSCFADFRPYCTRGKVDRAKLRYGEVEEVM